MPKMTNEEYVRAVYDYTPPTWPDRISPLSRDFWDQAKTILSAEHYTTKRNEVFEALVNRIGLTLVTSNNIYNPLSFFYRGNLMFGSVVQEINVDVTEEQAYDGGEPDQFSKSNPHVTATYSEINRQSVYTQTLSDPRIRRAFTDEYGLDALMFEIVDTLRKSNMVDEYIYCKKLINDLLFNNELPLQDTQKLYVPDVVSEDATVSDINKFIIRVKNTMRLMPHPSRNYTASRTMQCVAPSNMVLLLNTRYVTINEVTNLSQAFNADYLSFPVPIIGIDNFGLNEDGTPMNDIVGIICDKDMFSIYTTYQNTTVSINAKGLYQNHHFHIHQLYKPSAYKGAVYLLKEKKSKAK